LVDVLDNLCNGRGKPEDVDLLVNISNNMMGNTICAFADGTAMPMLGMVQKFREEFMDAAAHGLPDGVRHDDSVRGSVEGGA
jgi:NADH-quinone oxidoreductase subunit F